MKKYDKYIWIIFKNNYSTKLKCTEDNGRISIQNPLDEAVAKASWQKHRKLLPILVKFQKVNFWLLL